MLNHNIKQIANSKNLETTLDQEAISKIVHRIGHDIGNPLTSIISLASIIEKFSDPRFNTLDSTKLSSYASTISNEAWRISRLSESLVHTFSRRTPQLQEVIIDDILDRALAKVESQFINYPNIRIELDLPENLVALAEPDQLIFALTEVIRNAFQANIESDLELISISAEKTEGYCKISCINQLNSPIVENIGELFLPLVSHLKKTSSPGLGLFAVACILKRLEGYCEIETSSEFRTSIFLKWPS